MARSGLFPAIMRRLSIKSVLFALGVTYIGVNLFIGQQGLISWRDNAARVAELSAELDSLATHRSELEARLKLLDPARVDVDLVEELAARDLMMAHPDDLVVLLSEPGTASVTPASASAPAPAPAQ